MSRKQLPFVLLQPGNLPPDDSKIHTLLSKDDLREFIAGADPADVVALDIETKGSQAADPQSVVVGFSLADSRGAGWWTAELWPFALCLLEEHQTPLIAHNLFFDAAYAYRDMGRRWGLNWKYCTYGLYKQLATEGWPGQSWSLKSAQTELLGWKETNEVELNKWLVENGFIKARRNRIEDIKEREDWFYVASQNHWAKADKGQMWQAPAHILGKYCALDSWSTYVLFTRVLKPALDKFNVLQEYHTTSFVNLVEILIEQQLSGFLANVEELTKYGQHLREKALELIEEFLKHESVAPHVAEHNERVVQEHLAKEPARYKKAAIREEPKKKYKKDGSLSGLWLKWDEWKRTQTPTESKNWQNWNEKLAELKSQNHFNPNSGQQLAWLFYEKLGYEVLLLTDTGNPAVDARAMQQWGEPGALLVKQGVANKEASYVEAAVNYTIDGVIHPKFRVPGTLTGRLSGASGFNVQQQPKTREYLQHLHARPGHVWVDFDYAALEPSVLTELSRDPSMLQIYGPGVPKNDIYIFTGAHIPGIKESFLACGYDPKSPTKESIARIKKEHKNLRAICKVLVLSSQYGAGPRKIHETLKLQGVNKTLEEVQEIHRAYWELYKGIKEYERFLLKCWNRNNGWILNGIGRPLTIHGDLTKDIVNRVCQSTGHDIHMVGLTILRRVLFERKLEHSWVIADFHDESILEVPKGTENEVIDAFFAMEAELNELLKSYVPIKIDPAVGTSLADFKVEG